MDLGLPEILFIFVLALLLFGPKKLPEIGQQVGKFLAEFKRAKNEFQSQLQEEMRQLETEAAATKQSLVSAASLAPPPEGVVASGTLGEPHLPDNALPAASAPPKAPDA